MKIDEKKFRNMLHDIKLEEVELIECKSSKIDNDFIKEKQKKNNVEVNVSLESEVEEIDFNDKCGASCLSTRLYAENKFDVFVKYKGYFNYKSSSREIGDDEFVYFLEVQAIYMLLSYIRETVDMIFMKMGYSEIKMPIVDLNSLLRQKGVNN